MGMSEDEIAGLEKQGKPQQNLYLPPAKDKNVWVYVTSYEYEAELVKTGTPVEVRAIAYPGVSFEGSVISVTPMLEQRRERSKVRALVDNTENKLKLEMFGQRGDKVYHRRQAVRAGGGGDARGDTRYCFCRGDKRAFRAEGCKAGNKAGDYYEVLEGLVENEESRHRATSL